MKKRFTDADRFSDPWYRRLPPEQKLAWEWMYSQCDIAGVIDLDVEAAEFHIGVEVDWDAFLASAGDRIVKLPSGKYWLTKFIQFQYGTLSPSCNPHKPVIDLVEWHGINTAIKDLRLTIKRYLVPLSKVQDKEQDKEQESLIKEKESPPEIEKVFSHYRQRHPKARLGTKSARLIRDRLKEGFGVEDLIDAIDGNHRDPHCSGQNALGKKYHSLDLIFRDADHVTKYAELAGPSRNSEAEHRKRKRAEQRAALLAERHQAQRERAENQRNGTQTTNHTREKQSASGEPLGALNGTLSGMVQIKKPDDSG